MTNAIFNLRPNAGATPQKIKWLKDIIRANGKFKYGLHIKQYYHFKVKFLGYANEIVVTQDNARGLRR